MPLSLDPDRTVDYWLKSDEDKPLESRPVFVCRYMSRKEHHRHHDTMKRAVESKDDAETYRLLMDAVKIGVKDWRNFGRPFSFDAIDDVLTALELWELCWNYPLAARLSEREMGELNSPSPIATDASTSPVAAASAGTPA